MKTNFMINHYVVSTNKRFLSFTRIVNGRFNSTTHQNHWRTLDHMGLLLIISLLLLLSLLCWLSSKWLSLFSSLSLLLCDDCHQLLVCMPSSLWTCRTDNSQTRRWQRQWKLCQQMFCSSNSTAYFSIK